MSSCTINPYVGSACKPEPSKTITLPKYPPKTNGEMATQLRDLKDEVEIDNVRKEAANAQQEACE